MTELFSRSWQEMTNRFGPFFILAFIGTALNWLFSLIFVHFYVNMQSASFLILPLTLILSLIVSLLMTSALTLYICKRANTINEALRIGFPRILRLFLGGIIIGLAMMLVSSILVGTMIAMMMLTKNSLVMGFVVFCSISVILAVMLTITTYCLFLPYRLVLTNEPMFQCFRSSFALVKGYFWKTCGYLILLSLIMGAVTVLAKLVLMIFSFISSLVLPSFFQTLLSFLWVPIQATLAVFFQVFTLALYLDRNTAGIDISSQQDSTPSLEGQAEQ